MKALFICTAVFFLVINAFCLSLEEKVAYEKAHNLLSKNGFIALFWKTQEYDELDFLKNL